MAPRTRPAPPRDGPRDGSKADRDRSLRVPRPASEIGVTRKPNDNPNVGPDPVDARPNHVREKTYQAPDVPEGYERDVARLPEKTAEAKVERDMGDAVDAVKAKL